MNKNNIDNLDVVIYHNPCQDGITSAWIIYNYYKNKFQDKQLEFIGANYYNYNFTKILEDTKNKNIIIVDFSFNEDETIKLKNNCKNLLILDHHKTHFETLKKYDFAYFDMNKSGAGITWEYFYGNIEPPMFVQMIQDRDIWTKQIKNSFNFCDGLFHYMSITTDKFNLLTDLYNNPTLLDKYIEFGTSLNLKKQKEIETIVKFIKKTYKYKLDEIEYTVILYNTTSGIVSELGNTICDHFKHFNNVVAIMWRFDHETDMYNCSGRSIGDVDVSKLAVHFGGGGHKNAAGFTLDKHPCDIFLYNK